jgi:nucleotide-binding universal stress UspA family protein
MKHILLAVDRGAPSWEAARLTVHLAPKLKAAVTVVTVLVPGPQDSDAKDQRKREYETARELVDDIVDELGEAGVTAHGEVRSCNPGEVHEEILFSASRLGCDLIVIGSRARGELTGLLLGSVSQKVAGGSDRPVLIVPTGPMTKVAPRHIVLAMEGIGDAEIAAGVTAELAGTGSAEDSTQPGPDQKAVDRVVATLAKAGIEVQGRVIPNVRGLAPEIAREAVGTGADMIVIGSRGLGWVGEDVAGDVAAAVVKRTHRPVVVSPRRPRS